MPRSNDPSCFHPMLLALGTLALGLVLFACASDHASGEPAGSGPKVTFLIYSGRPNPSLTLNAGQVQRLQQLLAAAQPANDAEGRSVLPSILGYNGIVIESRGASGLPASIEIYRNRIAVHEQGAQRVLSDNGALEELLLSAGTESKALSAAELRVVQEGRQGGTPP
jgi:hypothetical protein